jgi:hypothetical protein
MKLLATMFEEVLAVSRQFSRWVLHGLKVHFDALSPTPCLVIPRSNFNQQENHFMLRLFFTGSKER